MKKILLSLVSVMLLVSLAWGQGMITIGKKKSSVVGSNTWYYPSGITVDNDDLTTSSAYGHSSYLYGNRIVAGETGTVTNIAVKLNNASSGTVKLGLYSVTYGLLAQCSGSYSSPSSAWVGCSITPTSVTNTTSYHVFYSADSDNCVMRYKASTTGYFATCAYADAMCANPTSPDSESSGYTARMCIGTCS